MTSSPDLIHELRTSRPSAPAELRSRIRAISAADERLARPRWAGWRIPVRRGVLVAVPAAAALALASAGVLGLTRSGSQEAVSREAAEKTTLEAQAAPSTTTDQSAGAGSAQALTPSPTATDRAQKVTATLTVEVEDANAVS